MPEAKRPIRVFLCHASQDKPAVRELYQRLKQEDWIDPWLDEEKLTLGQHWTSAIEDALDAADTIVIFLSHNSVQKEGFVQRELNYAWEISLEMPRNVIFLIPFRLDNCEVPRYLRSRQWGDYFGEEKEQTYQTLLRSLKVRHEQKLKLEEAERARKEKQEREIAEKIVREKAEKEAAEIARLGPGEKAQQKAAKKKTEHESVEKDAAEKATREKEEHETTEKVVQEKESRVKPQEDLSKIPELLKLADDAYYATQYEQAIQAYKEVIARVPKNKHAQKQLRNAELERSLKSPTPLLPREALQFYRRARTLLAVGDLEEARNFLLKSISVAKKAAIEFKEGEELLNNLQLAFRAVKFKEQALYELDSKQWETAVLTLGVAVDLDVTDEDNKILLTHLQGLLHAKYILEQSKANIRGVRVTKKHINKIKATLDQTKELTILSVLWQYVAQQLSDLNSRRYKSLVKNIKWSVLGAVLLTTGIMSSLYLFPHTYQLVDCSETTGLEVALKYPNYVANGDKEAIKVILKNVGAAVVNGEVLFDMLGATNVNFESNEANKIIIENMSPAEQNNATIEFSLNEPFRIISDTSRYIEFNLYIEGNQSSCRSRNFQIALSPVYGLRKILLFLLSIVSIGFISLFRERIMIFIGIK